MINFDVVDFSDRCSEEVMFLLTLSVVTLKRCYIVSGMFCTKVIATISTLYALACAPKCVCGCVCVCVIESACACVVSSVQYYSIYGHL